MNDFAQMTVGDIVSHDSAAAYVFDRFGIDFVAEVIDCSRRYVKRVASVWKMWLPVYRSEAGNAGGSSCFLQMAVGFIGGLCAKDLSPKLESRSAEN
ncbi:Uncharacterised protein [Porphyromonas macacae]|uniref:Uncharacterized protein n=2 Tax=Porphyromonas macacae TaxID=28115 RepID=A0A379EBT5_9PORP|nr:Uncharacterised protein [Porphyromonas macacae]